MTPGRPALLRFVDKCRFVPETGCVVWTGGQTKGRGHNAPYGSFWYDGRRWFAHRWAAKFIHGQDIEGMQVDHCCPHTHKPDTLCVQHVQSITPDLNRELQHRRFWAHLACGLISYEDAFGTEPDEPAESIPFWPEPDWYKKALQVKAFTDMGGLQPSNSNRSEADHRVRRKRKPVPQPAIQQG